MTKTVEIYCELVMETDLAYLINDGDEDVWVSKSQIHEDYISIHNGKGSIFIPEWLALEKGLI